jgi:hypothetical protein
VSEATDQPGPEDSIPAAEPRRPRRSPVVDLAVVGLGGYLLVWMFGDVRYFLQGSEPRDLGEASALVESGLDDSLADKYVVLRGTPDVQHAARMRLDERTIGFLRIVEGGGRLFAAIPRDDPNAAPNQFEGTFQGRMRRLADSPNFQAIKAHFDAERIVEERDATSEALKTALQNRSGEGLRVADSTGHTLTLGARDSITLVVDQPDAQIQLGRSSFNSEAEADAAVVALGVPFFKPAEQKSNLFYQYFARIPAADRESAQTKLSTVAVIPPDAKPADPRVGAVVVPWVSSYLVTAGTLALQDGKFAFTPGENAKPPFILQDGKLAPRPLKDGRLELDPSEVRAVRLEQPVSVDPNGYLVEVGVHPRDRLLELAMWLLVLVVVGWNLLSLAVWWRARRA